MLYTISITSFLSNGYEYAGHGRKTKAFICSNCLDRLVCTQTMQYKWIYALRQQRECELPADGGIGRGEKNNYLLFHKSHTNVTHRCSVSLAPYGFRLFIARIPTAAPKKANFNKSFYVFPT